MTNQNGFILAATLWILAAITLSAGFFALWTQHALELARRGEENLHGEIDLSGTQATLLYLLCTQPMTLGGLTVPEDKPDETSQENMNPMDISMSPIGGEIALDDRPYKGLGKACFSVQDEGGLMGLNNFYTSHLENLLGLLGVPAPHRGPLLDKLLDYTDMDDLHRLNGAEEDEYRRMGLPAPPNRFLLTSWEIANVLDWKDQPGLWSQTPIPRLTTISSGGAPNLNTAPKEILMTLTGIDADTAVRLIEAREEKPFASVREVQEAAGSDLSLDPLGTALFPSAYLRLTLWQEGGPRMREVHVCLTPRADKKAPWLIDYELLISMTQEQKHEAVQAIPSPVFAPALYPNPQ
jgi:DNA uptake protein ComE-like DNA-binding protein